MTFAGSPDRAEARLVPEAGFELDTFRVSGLPRRPGIEQARAALHALAAPAACERILGAPEPDVVLGGGGYVRGPMVLAAARRRIPSALTEADAHLGLANRLAAAVRSSASSSRIPIPGREPPKYRVTGRPIPERSRPVAREEARAPLRAARRRAGAPRRRRQPGRAALNELAIEASAPRGPAVLHSDRRARLRRACAVAPPGPTIGCCRCTTTLGAASARPIWRCLVRAADGLGARRSRATGDARPVPVRHRRPSDEERALLRDGRRSDPDPRGRARPRAGDRALAARRSRPPGRDGRMRCAAWHARTRPSEIAEELIALAAARG